MKLAPLEHEHVNGPVHRDNNMRVAIIHVLADAPVSVLVIVGLLFGRFLGWTWMDPRRPHAEPSSSPLGPTDSCETLAPSSST